MARQRRTIGSTPARSAPTRPTAAPAAAPQSQNRPASTAAAPPAQAQQAPPQAQSSGPGLLGQVASTAAGVAIGSSIGHAVGSFFTGGSSAPAEAQQAPAPEQAQAMDNGLYQNNTSANSWESGPCAADIKSFRSCMDENRGDMSICGWYMDQLKACQQAAKPY